MSFETGGTCVLAWKKRDGLMGLMARQGRKWEQRWIVLADGAILYYSMGDEDRFGEADFEARGKLDLRQGTCRVEVSSQPSPDAPTPNEVDVIHTQTPSVATTEGATSAPPSAHGHGKAPKPVITKWKFCFETQQSLVEFLEKAHAALEESGQLEAKDVARFEHDFHPADHIYRWEMIVCPPVIYPIQIHGIVLEAGRNAVVVADFGLTGYGKKSTSDEFHHSNDEVTHNRVVAAFKKLRPHSDQRLHIVTLTDPLDIRKWTKAHYDETSFQDAGALRKLNKLSKLFKNVKLPKGSAKLQDELATSIVSSSSQSEELTSASTSIRMADLETKSLDDIDDAQLEENDNNLDDEYEEDLAASGASPPSPLRQRAQSEDPSTLRNNQNNKPAFTEEYSKQRQEEHPLPKADPKELVLSRANFLLEFGEEKLPPYHVFYSNSECIAVWCKTGRWSTLQTAVFLSSNAIGGAKSATVATLGVAAAHAILAPVVAVGGLLWVSAPMVILKKSREKWETNTRLMTDLYWQEWAPPSVFVCAIEHWSEVGYTTQEAKRKQRLLEEQAAEREATEEEHNSSIIKKYSSEEILGKKSSNGENTPEVAADDADADKEASTNGNDNNNIGNEEEEFEDVDVAFDS